MVPKSSRMENIHSSFTNFPLNRGGTSIAIITAEMTKIPATATMSVYSFLLNISFKTVYITEKPKVIFYSAGVSGQNFFRG